MSIYTPKIDISQFANSIKARTENANGEIQMLIEKSFPIQDKPSDDKFDNFESTKLSR